MYCKRRKSSARFPDRKARIRLYACHCIAGNEEEMSTTHLDDAMEFQVAWPSPRRIGPKWAIAWELASACDRSSDRKSHITDQLATWLTSRCFGQLLCVRHAQSGPTEGRRDSAVTRLEIPFRHPRCVVLVSSWSIFSLTKENWQVRLKTPLSSPNPNIYSKTCAKRPPLGANKSGLCRQVASIRRFNTLK